MLKAVNIFKTFPGVKALDGVNMTFDKGEVTAILGENGAGKSTLLKILSGIYQDYEGDILIDEVVQKFEDITQSQAAGIAIIHQELNLIAELDIAENLFLGNEITNIWGILDKSKMEKICLEQLQKVGLEVSPKTKIKDLKIGEQQLVEIAKALLFDAQIIFMDEPTSALSNKEIEKLNQIVFELKKQGKIVVYISHKMDELFAIADRYEVLRDGVSVGSGKMSEITETELIKMMAGREKIVKSDERKVMNYKTRVKSDELLLEIKNYSYSSLITHNLSLYKGEILGIFGLMGAGRTELLSSIFGLNFGEVSGQIYLNGKECTFRSPKDAIDAGLAFLTEDRKSEGLILNKDISFNISLSTLPEFSLLNPKKETAESEAYIKSLAIKTPSAATICQNLSGGNQQKVVIAKWLSTRPKVLLMDEPTRGIDINAKNEIYALIQELSAQGLGIIVASSEIPELLAISDRILVMSEGRLTGNFPIDEANEENLLKTAIL
jgi:ribose transport system ATP-binding protein